MKKRLFAALTLCAALMFSGCGNSARESLTESDPISEPVSVAASEPESVPAESSDKTSEQTSAPSTEPVTFEVNPPLFKAENKETGAVVYMMGSMHVGKTEAVYPEKMYKALDECDTLAVEVDIQALENDLRAASEAMAILICERGKTVKNYLGEDYDLIIGKFREKGMYNKIYESYIPALWSSLWTSNAAAECGYDVNEGTDRHLLTYAKEHGKSVEEIESAKEQYQVEADCSAELQAYSLKQAVELSDEEMKEQLDMLYNAWKDGDIAALRALAEDEDEELPETLAEDSEKYYDAMYTNRQKKMAEYVINKLNSGGKTFVVVGALHYAAPPSIIDVLEENGYTVETLS